MTRQFAEATPQQVVVVPCSGIGKSYGTVTREAAYMVVEDLCPDTTHIVPLSLLVLGDEQAQEAVRGGVQVITIDGCKLACATVNVGQAGGHVAREFTVLDCYRRNKQFKPQGIAELNEGGQALAQALAQEVAQAAGELSAQGGTHA